MSEKHHANEQCKCGHHHEHQSCGCGHHHEHEHHDNPKKEILEIGIAAILFILSVFLQNLLDQMAIVPFVIAYIVLGRSILITAGKNILKGRIFDENFLMSIATLAAFAIGDYPEAVGVMLFFRVGELFEEIAVQKSRTQIMKAVDMRPETVQVVHEHGIHVIPAKDVKVGDIILVRVGDRIPLDAVVVEGGSFVDTAPVTGEPVPVRVIAGDAVISGCVNTSEVLKMRVERTLEHSMVTRILNSVENAASSKPKVDRFITRFARVYTPCVVFLATATALIPSFITGDWSKWIYTAVSFLVISCPCALVISVPLTYFAGIGYGSKKQILFKGGLVLETLQRVKAVVLDKTGTLTQGNFEVQKCMVTEGYHERDLIHLASTCEMRSVHPIAASILKKAKELQIEAEEAKTVREVAGKGICAVTKEKEIICGNKELLFDYNIRIDEELAHTVGMQTGGTEVYVACNSQLVGCILIADSIKEDSKESVSMLKHRGIKTVMLTGDTVENAKMVAEKTGVEEVFAKLLPDEKLEHLQEVRKQYGEVMFVGDGINDAPVLAGADIGAAMGSGADAAIEAADVVFMTSSMRAIPTALQIANMTNRIAIQNIVFALLMKGLVLVLGLLGFANMWMSVFADTGVAMICILNSVRILKRK